MKAFILLLLASLTATAVSADEWKRFRGQGGASAAQVDLPSEWSVETGANIAWQADLPGKGVSCPIVTGGQVIVTASGGLDETRLRVLSFDTRTGRPLWDRQFWATGRTNCHNTSAVAANTPCTDGERVYALFSSNDLICLDVQGALQWTRSLTEDHPGLGNDIGMASSVVSLDGVVVVQCECQQGSFAAGYDCRTGEQLWEDERPSAANWASPTAYHAADGRGCVVLQSGSRLTILDIKSGEQLWEEPINCATIASATVADNRLHVPADGLLTLDLNGAEPDIAWKESALAPGSPSPVVADGRLYVINRAGVLTAADAATGDRGWKARLAGSFWATPVVSAGKLVAINSKGDAFVVSVEDGQVLAKPKFGEDISATPAVADGGMFVRSNGKLWKIAVIQQASRRGGVAR